MIFGDGNIGGKNFGSMATSSWWKDMRSNMIFESKRGDMFQEETKNFYSAHLYA